MVLLTEKEAECGQHNPFVGKFKVFVCIGMLDQWLLALG
jgi:hypothetical protein